MLSQDGIEDDEKLAHAGGERELFGLSCRHQPLIEGGNQGIATGSDKCGHVKRRPVRGSSAADRPSSTHSAAIAAEWSDADEGGDLAAVEAIY